MGTNHFYLSNYFGLYAYLCKDNHKEDISQIQDMHLLLAVVITVCLSDDYDFILNSCRAKSKKNYLMLC